MTVRACVKFCSDCGHFFAVRSQGGSGVITQLPGDLSPCCGRPLARIVECMSTLTEAVTAARAMRHAPAPEPVAELVVAA